MMQPERKSEMGKMAVAFAAFAGIAFAVPSAVFALGGSDSPMATTRADFAPFTPASVDPALAKRVAETMRAKGLDLRFTPAGAAVAKDTTVTVAIRVNDRTMQAIRTGAVGTITQPQSAPGSVAIAPTKYNLGIARGYQSFAKTPELPAGVKSVEMPDLAEFKPSQGTAPDKPSRFKTRMALEQDDKIGRAPQTLEGLGEQSFDLGGAYRVTKNLDVTAGVRLSQERDRLDPLTDNVQDSQAVYVGTQFRF